LEALVKDKRIALLRSTRQLLRLLLQHPQEFYGRVAVQVGFRLEQLVAEHLFGKPPQYETVSWEKLLQDMEARFDGIADILEEPALDTIEKSVRQLYADIRYELVGDPEWGADLIMARCCYLACRLLKPNVVVEGGVSYGVSSAFILQALKENDHGTLYSLDLPSLRPNFEKFWGIAVPEELKGRWELYRGYSRHVLPKILRETEKVDIFVEDVGGTYRHIKWNYETVWPYLRAGSIIISNQVHRNRAFNEVQQLKPAFWRVVRDQTGQPLFSERTEQPIMFGIAVK
jgi:hypothetical protein